jgi:hypothetical protein
MAEYMTIGGPSGHVIERINLPHSNQKNYALVYEDGKLTAHPLHWRIADVKAKFIEVEEGIEFVRDDTGHGERRPWGMGHFASLWATYLIEGVTWQVLIDSVGWPFIIQKVQSANAEGSKVQGA